MKKKLTSLPYILCYLCAFVLGMKQLREPDIWWQLLSGRWMLENGEVTRTDSFSYTMAGTKWVNVKWLYEVIIAVIERGMGPHGVMFLQSLVNVAIVFLLLRVLQMFSKHLGQQVSTLYSTITVLVFLVISETRMAGRPEMISHLLTVVYMLILWQSNGFAWKRILWLIPLQCLWANMHEAYPVGMAIIAVYIAGGFISYLANKDKEYLQSTIRLGAIWIGMALAILINPNTIQLWTQPFEIFRQLHVNQYTTELFSVKEAEYWTLQGKAHIVLLTGVCLFWIYRIVLNRKAKEPVTFSPMMMGYLLSILMLGYLSLTANRNIPFAQIALFPSIPVLILWVAQKLNLQKKDLYTKAATKTVLISAVVAGLFYVSIVNNSYYKFTKSRNKYGLHVNMFHNPTAAAEFIKTYNLKGPAFSDYFVSSYLLWDLYPDFKSYIDLRDLDIFPAKFFDNYMELNNKPQKFYELDSVYKFNYIVLSISQLVSLQQMLYWQEGFNVVHIDPVSIILLRDNEANTHINRGPAAQKLFTWPQESIDPGWAEALTTLLNPAVTYDTEDEKYMPIYAGKFYNMIRNPRVALKFMLPAVQTDFSEDADALTTIGHIYKDYADYSETKEERLLKLDSARRYFDRSLEIDPDMLSTRLGLAILAINANDYITAGKHLEKYIEKEKTNDYVYYLNGICKRHVWQSGGDKAELKKGIENFEKSLRLNRHNDRLHLFLAEAYWYNEEKEKARESMKKILKDNIPWTEYDKELLNKMKKLTGFEAYKTPMDIIKPDEHEGHNH